MSCWALLQTIGLYRTIRNALVFLYEQLCLSKRWDVAGPLSQQRRFKTMFKAGTQKLLPKKSRWEGQIWGGMCGRLVPFNSAPQALHPRRPKGDPQENTAAAAITDAEALQMAECFLSKSSPAGDRDRCV